MVHKFAYSSSGSLATANVPPLVTKVVFGDYCSSIFSKYLTSCFARCQTTALEQRILLKPSHSSNMIQLLSYLSTTVVMTNWGDV